MSKKYYSVEEKDLPWGNYNERCAKCGDRFGAHLDNKCESGGGVFSRTLPQNTKVVSKTTHNKSSFQLPSFSAWKKRILKDYERDGCDWVAMQDFYDYMKELVNKKR